MTGQEAVAVVRLFEAMPEMTSDELEVIEHTHAHPRMREYAARLLKGRNEADLKFRMDQVCYRYLRKLEIVEPPVLSESL